MRRWHRCPLESRIQASSIDEDTVSASIYSTLGYIEADTKRLAIANMDTTADAGISMSTSASATLKVQDLHQYKQYSKYKLYILYVTHGLHLSSMKVTVQHSFSEQIKCYVSRSNFGRLAKMTSHSRKWVAFQFPAGRLFIKHLPSSQRLF